MVVAVEEDRGHDGGGDDDGGRRFSRILRPKDEV